MSSMCSTHPREHFLEIKKNEGDIPGGAGDENSSANAKDTGSSPWSVKIPRGSEQLSRWATATEPALWSPRAAILEARTP